ncbi:MAG TPA: hypothetical protein V6C97_14845 [Oculatellaceae cyanobacterium]
MNLPADNRVILNDHITCRPEEDMILLDFCTKNQVDGAIRTLCVAIDKEAAPQWLQTLDSGGKCRATWSAIELEKTATETRLKFTGTCFLPNEELLSVEAQNKLREFIKQMLTHATYGNVQSHRTQR